MTLKRYNTFLYIILFCCTLTIRATSQKNNNPEASKNATAIKTLIVFFDGLRPDYITGENMPNLFAFKKSAAYAANHHSVFPTVTRVNASSLSTGCYPAKHGLMGNTVYFPAVNKSKGLNTGDAANLIKINEATNGHLLTAITLGEVLQSAGEKMMVFSSGSSGQAFLQNHTISGGAIINTSIILPASLQKTIIDEIGLVPPNSKPNSAQHKWITDALIKFGFADNGPLVNAIWYSDPDGTAHSDGIGSPTAISSIKAVDEQFGRIIKTLKDKKQFDRFNIIISTDHGFVTHKGKQGLAEYLIKEGFKRDSTSQDVIVAEGAIYVKDHDAELIKRIVAKLQQQEWVGAIFTKATSPGSIKGSVKGTLSFETIHWNHPDRAADILVDENWNDDKNDIGFKGTGYAKGIAGHGGISPYEIHIPLIVSGPAFKKSFESNLPTSNVDITPTILFINHINIPATMDGRILSELLSGSVIRAKKIRPEIIEVKATQSCGTYQLTMQRSIVNNHSYVNYAKVVRTVRAK